jgi:hypothetical protein
MYDWKAFTGLSGDFGVKRNLIRLLLCRAWPFMIGLETRFAGKRPSSIFRRLWLSYEASDSYLLGLGLFSVLSYVPQTRSLYSL